MPSIVLKKFSDPQQISNKDILNTINPLSLREWIANNIGIIPNQVDAQYNKYLESWYSNKKDSVDLTINYNKVKDDYIALLQRLSVIFKNDEEFNRMATIDFSNQMELKIAIPYFARKLKEIALYYINKRESLKKTKMKYNMVGSNNALERILYEYILQAFTKKDYNLTISSKDIYNNVPELSAISSDFSLEIENLYDQNNYFDLDYSKQFNTTGVYDLSSNNPLIFILEDYIANIYNAFNLSEVPLSGFSNPLSEFTLCETDTGLNEQILSQLGSKYIGNDIYFLTGGFYDFNRKPVSLDIINGNNFFYWFSGEYVREIPDGMYADVSINDINWTNATGASSVELADIVFSQVGNIVTEGAWLMDSPIQIINDTMSATMTDGKIFKFPYPGIGTSAEGGSWSGKLLLDTNPDSLEFFPSQSSFLSNKESIANIYWSAVSSISTVNSILLQDTNLYKCGAYAANNYEKADKVIVRRNVSDDDLHDINPNGIFNGTLETSWLYNFSETEIPISKGITNIYYPLSTYIDVSDLFFRYESGNDISLSSINVGSSFSGAIAGDNVSNSDILIKLNSICGPEIEAAWLKGIPLSTYNNINFPNCDCDKQYIDYYTGYQFEKGVTQPGLSFQCIPGNTVRFVWTGPITNINDVIAFTGFDHDDSCPYKQSNNFPSILNTNFLQTKNSNIYEKWKTCTCKTVNYSPLGHNKNTLLFYKFPTDFIVKDTQFPTEFNINSWKGFDFLPYNTSEDLAWFRTSNLLETDVGWGKGEWKTNNENVFYLEPGKSYIYYRSNLEVCNFSLPYIVINSGYCDCNINNCVNIQCLPIWQKAVLDGNNNWIDSGQISDMVLNSGKFYSFTHRSSLDYSKNILTYKGNIINSLSGDFVSLSSIDPNINYKSNTITYPSINFLIKISLFENSPYWGKASFDNNLYTQNKLKLAGSLDYTYTLDYLQVKQPSPSNTLLSDDNTLEYKMSTCNSCFIWTENLNFSVLNHTRRWNKILIDNCVKSDILNFLHEKTCEPCSPKSNACLSQCQELDLCGCNNYCFPTKTGVTASYIPSDIIFNTELSGIPIFIDYYAQNSFTLNFDVVDITNGIPPNGGLWIPPISSIYSQANIPWLNIINERYPLVASEQGNLVNKQEIGLFTPERLATGRYELYSGKYEINYIDRNKDNLDLFRNNNYFDSPLNVNKIDSSWMKKKSGQKDSGNILVDKHQTFYPYTTNFEINNFNNFGLWEKDNNFSPWTSDGKWKDSDKFPANFRGQFPINCGPNSWYNNQLNLSGNIKQWQTDVYGNQYFLMFSDNTSKLDVSTTYGEMFIKLQNGSVYTSNDILGNIFNKYKNLNFGTTTTIITSMSSNIFLLLEDNNFITIENGDFIAIG